MGLGFVLILGVESDLPSWLGWRGHSLPDCVEDNFELRVVFLLHRRQFAGQFGIGSQHLPQPDKGAHHLHAVCAARSLFNTFASINAPCSVKA